MKFKNPIQIPNFLQIILKICDRGFLMTRKLVNMYYFSSFLLFLFLIVFFCIVILSNAERFKLSSLSDVKSIMGELIKTWQNKTNSHHKQPIYLNVTTITEQYKTSLYKNKNV